MDRRIKKSKTALKKAMFTLMQRKNIKDITIRELCDLADINRSTFYSNYEHIPNLIKDIHKDFFDDMFYNKYSTLNKHKIDSFIKSSIILDMITYVEQNKKTIAVLFANNENNTLEQNLLSFFMETCNISSTNYTIAYPFMYHTMAFLTLLHAWVKDDYPCSSQKLCEIIMKQSASL